MYYIILSIPCLLVPGVSYFLVKDYKKQCDLSLMQERNEKEWWKNRAFNKLEDALNKEGV